MTVEARIRSLLETIESDDPAIRDRSLSELLIGMSTSDLLAACKELERFRRRSENLYERVRASMFLHAIYQYHIQESPEIPASGYVPYDGFEDLLDRRFERAIALFLRAFDEQGPNGTVASALAQAYEQITYQTLADQVRRSVRSCSGNRWMFRVGGVDEQPLRLVPALLDRASADALFPILIERTPVRLDLSHSAWSDIFFLGMDYPEGARVLNISVDLGVHGRDAAPVPPISVYVRVLAEPILRLTSLDLNACKDVDSLEELFNFGNDYLGLVKAGVIASGLVPPSLEGTGTALADVLARVVRPGHGLEVTTAVNDIPKGSRLAVSTNLLASIISALMRATGQARRLTGTLEPDEARVVVARAILGEWLGGSGGGWQDSGGVFPGVKIIEGVPSGPTDPEHGISRGRLLPSHQLLDQVAHAYPHTSNKNDMDLSGRSPLADDRSESFARTLAESLVLVHGGMAQNVGPILNMVTQKYLLRSGPEWEGRRDAGRIFERIVHAVQTGDVAALGGLTTANWEGPLKGIIPWVSNHFTETIIAQARATLEEDFWGFLMLGGMSGGGMAFFTAPHRRDEFRREIAAIMRNAKASLEEALPFAMEPVVYDFRINPLGTHAELITDARAMMPAKYYTLQVPRMIEQGARETAASRRADVDHFSNHCGDPADLIRVFRAMINNLFPVPRSAVDRSRAGWDETAEMILRANGFDATEHERLREDLIRGRIGLARNRLPVDTDIRDVDDRELVTARGRIPATTVELGRRAIEAGEVAVVSLAAGVGSRWTTGAGVVKAINPFVMIDGRHRAFLEIHFAKTKRSQKIHHVRIPHIVTTSYLTHSAIERRLEKTGDFGHDGPVFLSPGRSIGKRLVPMTRDLTFLWEETSHETLDENKQKVRAAGRRAILDWARGTGEGSDYTDNTPIQRFNPPGHFHEIPNLLKNGVLARVLTEFPKLKYLLVHNIDTLGASIDPGVLGRAIESGASVSFEVIPRRIEDRGGGLAKVNGRLRLLEGLAQPREETEFRLRYYNTLTTWVEIDGLLKAFGLTRDDPGKDPAKVAAAVREVASRVPTYVTIKDVKRRWGHGQEDVFPAAQFEKLWGDVTSLPDLSCSFLVVDRGRGRQLKDTAQLDGWANDGGLEYVKSLCDFH